MLVGRGSGSRRGMSGERRETVAGGVGRQPVLHPAVVSNPPRNTRAHSVPPSGQ